MFFLNIFHLTELLLLTALPSYVHDFPVNIDGLPVIINDFPVVSDGFPVIICSFRSCRESDSNCDVFVWLYKLTAI